VNQGVTVNQELGRHRIKQMFGAIGPGRRGGKSALAFTRTLSIPLVLLGFALRTCGGLDELVGLVRPDGIAKMVGCPVRVGKAQFDGAGSCVGGGEIIGMRRRGG